MSDTVEYEKFIELKGLIASALAGFVSDPADSEYQLGYLAALLWVANQLELEIPEVLVGFSGE